MTRYRELEAKILAVINRLWAEYHAAPEPKKAPATAPLWELVRLLRFADQKGVKRLGPLDQLRIQRLLTDFEAEVSLTSLTQEDHDE